MLHVYGWRRDGGPFFLDNARTLEDGIKSAEKASRIPAAIRGPSFRCERPTRLTRLDCLHSYGIPDHSRARLAQGG